MGDQKSSIPYPKAVTKIKCQMRKRWKTTFDAFQEYMSKDTDQIVDDVYMDIPRGVIRWDYGPLEAVLAYWSNKRILGELANAGRRRKLVPRADKPPEDQDDAAMARAEGLWCGSLPTQEDALTRMDLRRVCEGHDLETQLVEMVLEDPGLIINTNFKAQEIQEEFVHRGVPLKVDDVHALIDRLRKLFKTPEGFYRERGRKAKEARCNLILDISDRAIVVPVETSP